MYRLVLSASDVERKRPLDITRTVLRYVAPGDDVGSHHVNQKTPLLFGYPSPHDMRAESGKTRLPEPGTLSRTDIHLGLTKNLREIAKVSFLTAYRAVDKAKLRILDIDGRTVEACAEASLAAPQGDNPGMRVLLDESHQVGGALRPNPHAGKLIAAGAPGYRLLVRKDGSAFDWSFLVRVYEAIVKTEGRVLEGDPVIEGCLTEEEAIDCYLRNVLIQEAWVSVYDLVSDGLEIPCHEVLALYTKDGVYIGRVICNAGLNAVIPKLCYTDEELINCKVDFFAGRHEKNQSLGHIVQRENIFNPWVEVHCDERVFFSRLGFAPGQSVKSHSYKHTVDPSTLEPLPSLRCGSMGYRWAIDGDLVHLRKGDRPMFDQSYAMMETWPSESDFPLLFPIQQEHANDAKKRSWSDRFKQNLLLPPETIEFQERLSQKLRRDVADSRGMLQDPFEREALTHLLLKCVSEEQIENSAQFLEASLYEVETAGVYPAEEKSRLGELRRSDQERRSVLIASLLNLHPFLERFGPMTHWAILRASVGDSTNVVENILKVDLVTVLAELVLLGSASAAGKPPSWFRQEPALLAVGRWAEGRINLEEVQDLASIFTTYENKAKHLEAKVKSVGAALSRENDVRERSRELGVAYAGERVTVRPSDRVESNETQSLGLRIR
ncbi:hypothetical protein EJA70_02915 [Pseudomonas sp. PB103]|uniref:hypothetical protein n=1 Tax=Pseudomonas sp. PB103 TaxID=2494698 RepID=UPI00131CB8D1|nr:hypothetical protein [Pseudomonas sp. PB103]KAE9648092.1 hypothetical protein EJA70_02915 [Pseudomonas sp. PB103]